MGIKTIYLLKDLARASGPSVYTVEFYLKKGLIREFGRGPSTGYRYFDDKAVRQLARVRGMRKKGMSIDKIKSQLGAKRGSLVKSVRSSGTVP
jgi:DNA-binding transcriptional MerR regulator